MKKIYLDYASTTPVDKRVIKAMEPFLTKNYGNTMSLHSFGQEAKLALENSRQVLADLINAKPNEIIFTGSATESNNQALKGVALRERSESKGGQYKNHIIISAIEHACIMESAKWLAKNGFEITKLPVDKYGMVNPEDVKKAITPKTILVSVMHTSNEIGTIEPIAEIGKICREKGVYFHTDAVQSFGKIAIDVKKYNIDLLTGSAHKMYGPKGIALLYVREGVKIEPILHGGGQENGLRSSTVNVPAIVGFAKAAELCKVEMKKEGARQIKLRDKAIKEILKIKGTRLNGHSENRLPNNINVSFPYIEGESLIIRLDLEGIACSTGSACSSYKLEPSYVLLAIGLKPEEAHGSLRISLGRFTTEKEINHLLKVLPKIVKQLELMSPFKKKYEKE
ncbi:MAG: cysteine desulfurase family protein [Candidatus Staskawiczbacteria bacterium]|nr:cysteine desulfurase family protein [Candidatus Staskawiczbacteria bacterium]